MSERKTPEAIASTAELILASPVTVAFNVLSDRWTWLIIRELFLGYHRFEDLRRRTGAARGTLTERLGKLREQGILRKEAYQDKPVRHEYRLTKKGVGLYPLALLAWAWEHKWAAGYQELPEVLIHRVCDKATIPELHCTGCNEAVHANSTTFKLKPGLMADVATQGVRRRRRQTAYLPEGVDTSFFHAIDLFGDRWTGMVLGAILFELHRYDDIAGAIGIATNILASRLKLLVQADVIEKRAYQKSPTRYEYRLTEKGRDFHAMSLALHSWSNRWLVSDNQQNLDLHHDCGSPLSSIVVCGACAQPLEPGSVYYGEQNPILV